MPLFVKQNCAIFYVHVPKTGGTSIEQFFLKNGFRGEFLDGGGPNSFNRYRRCAPQHMHAAQLQAMIRPPRLDYVFMTVREPLRRLVSEYAMFRRLRKEAPLLGTWFEQTLKRYAQDEYTAENHIRPQVEFILPTCEIFRLEDGFGSDFVERIEQRIGLKFDHRQVEKSNADRSDPIDPSEIELVRPRVRQFYRQDYLTFGY